MENTLHKTLCTFLKDQEVQADQRLRHLSEFLLASDPSIPTSTTPSLPPHAQEILHLLRQHAEEDYSNLIHLQSLMINTNQDKLTKPPLQLDIVPNTGPAPHAGRAAPLGGGHAPPIGVVNAPLREGEIVMGEAVEVGVAATDDMFLIEGLEDSRSPQSLTFSDDDPEDSELDEGIHIPRRRANKEPIQVAASQPVGIPWPSNLVDFESRHEESSKNTNNNPTDIAASIRAMARSVHGSSVFGDLPRPRVNALSKN